MTGITQETGRATASPDVAAFEHQAFLYAGAAAFLGGTVPFIQAGLESGEPVLVVVDDDKISELRHQLGDDAWRVSFADMADVGRNPARIIPAWRDFVAARGGHGPVRGIGEPVWAGRTPDELAECQRHEALLNVAFAAGPPWRLLCPYDTSTLADDVLGAARHTHRYVRGDGPSAESRDYMGDEWDGGSDSDLGEPPSAAAMLDFADGPLEPVRRFVAHQLGGTLSPSRLTDLLQAVTEVAGNSLVHGGGAGTLRTWRTDTGAVCEVRDRGSIRDPLVGRVRPGIDQEGGRGLWMVNQLCDLVQLRSSARGTVVRMHVYTA
jgi:anti-sigma regulatory factor (Ser/Thr protein kinase)